jgi:hypothetical protein
MDKEEKYYLDSYFTLVKSFLAIPTTPVLLITIVNTLIDNFISLSLIYQIISKNHILKLIKPLIKDIQTFIVNSILRYNTYCFYRVIINTGASRYSITSSD